MSDQILGGAPTAAVADPGWPGSLRELLKNPTEKLLAGWLVVVTVAAVVATCLAATGVIRPANATVAIVIAVVDWVVALVYVRALTAQMRDPQDPPTGLIRASRLLLVELASVFVCVGFVIGAIIAHVTR